NSGEKKTESNETNRFEKDNEKAGEEVKEKIEKLTSKKKHDHH
ncbi:rRNA processing protein, partial [Enterococcus faecium]